MNSAAPDAFLFDLDGTLVDSERENIESVVLALRRHGAEMSAEERQFVIGHSWNEIYGMVARNHSLPLTMTQLIAEAVDEKRKLLAVSGHRALPGAVSAVKRFALTSKLAVVTGASTAEARDSIAGRGLHARQAGARTLRAGDRAPRRQRRAVDRGRGRYARDLVGACRRRAGHRGARRQLRRLRPVASRPGRRHAGRRDRRGRREAARVKVDPAALTPDAAYFWQVATILPRPIAWTSTLNEDGSANLAPF